MPLTSESPIICLGPACVGAHPQHGQCTALPYPSLSVCTESKSARGERLGPSQVFPGHVDDLGHLCDLQEIQEYFQIFPELFRATYNNHVAQILPPSFFLVRLIFATGISVPGSWKVK